MSLSQSTIISPVSIQTRTGFFDFPTELDDLFAGVTTRECIVSDNKWVEEAYNLS